MWIDMEHSDAPILCELETSRGTLTLVGLAYVLTRTHLVTVFPVGGERFVADEEETVSVLGGGNQNQPKWSSRCMQNWTRRNRTPRRRCDWPQRARSTGRTSRASLTAHGAATATPTMTRCLTTTRSQPEQYAAHRRARRSGAGGRRRRGAAGDREELAGPLIPAHGGQALAQRIEEEELAAAKRLRKKMTERPVTVEPTKAPHPSRRMAVRSATARVTRQRTISTPMMTEPREASASCRGTSTRCRTTRL